MGALIYDLRYNIFLSSGVIGFSGDLPLTLVDVVDLPAAAYPDPWEDLEGGTPNLGASTTKGYVTEIPLMGSTALFGILPSTR